MAIGWPASTPWSPDSRRWCQEVRESACSLSLYGPPRSRHRPPSGDSTCMPSAASTAEAPPPCGNSLRHRQGASATLTSQRSLRPSANLATARASRAWAAWKAPCSSRRIEPPRFRPTILDPREGRHASRRRDHITKVADQTNLLSSRRHRGRRRRRVLPRLPWWWRARFAGWRQTAVATLDIETMCGKCRTHSRPGLMQMDKFRAGAAGGGAHP